MIGVVAFFNGFCSGGAPSSTGWEYNNPKNGGFGKRCLTSKQSTGPGLVLMKVDVLQWEE